MQNSCGHAAAHRTHDYCFGCLRDKLCDANLLPIQSTRLLNKVQTVMLVNFPSMRTKTKLRLWSVLLPGVVAAARQATCNLVHVYDMVTKNFKPWETFRDVLPQLLFHFEPATAQAELVLQVVAFLAQQPPQPHFDCVTELLNETRFTDYIVRCLTTANDATKETSLFIAWSLLSDVATDGPEGGGGGGGALQLSPAAASARQQARQQYTVALSSAVETSMDSLAAVLIPGAKTTQLQLNLLGVLLRLLRCQDTKTSSERQRALVQAAVLVGQPSMARQLLQCMVQVRTLQHGGFFLLQLAGCLCALCAIHDLSEYVWGRAPY